MSVGAGKRGVIFSRKFVAKLPIETLVKTVWLVVVDPFLIEALAF